MSTTHNQLRTSQTIYTIAPVIFISSLRPQLLHSQARLQWKRCADSPVGMYSAQAVVIGEKVYVGGEFTEKVEDNYRIFQYNTSGDEWSRLPPHSLVRFAMAQFTGHLITVGGETAMGGVHITGKVYNFKEESQEWEEFLKPMPTARCAFTVATTQSAIIASGGITGVRGLEFTSCATVEVYSSETSQWHTADPLPEPLIRMSSVTIANTCYLLGGTSAGDKATVLYASLTSLVQKTTSPTHQSASHTSVWKTLPDTPLKWSAAGSLGGHLLAIGGWKGKTSTAVLGVRALATLVGVTLPTSSAVHVFFPFTNSWIRVTDGNLPEPSYLCTAVQLSSNEMIVIGGVNNQAKPTKTVYIGTINV